MVVVVSFSARCRQGAGQGAVVTGSGGGGELRRERRGAVTGAGSLTWISPSPTSPHYPHSICTPHSDTVNTRDLETSTQGGRCHHIYSVKVGICHLSLHRYLSHTRGHCTSLHTHAPTSPPLLCSGSCLVSLHRAIVTS